MPLPYKVWTDLPCPVPPVRGHPSPLFVLLGHLSGCPSSGQPLPLEVGTRPSLANQKIPSLKGGEQAGAQGFLDHGTQGKRSLLPSGVEN